MVEISDLSLVGIALCIVGLITIISQMVLQISSPFYTINIWMVLGAILMMCGVFLLAVDVIND